MATTLININFREIIDEFDGSQGIFWFLENGAKDVIEFTLFILNSNLEDKVSEVSIDTLYESKYLMGFHEFYTSLLFNSIHELDRFDDNSVSLDHAVMIYSLDYLWFRLKKVLISIFGNKRLCDLDFGFKIKWVRNFCILYR